MTAAGTDFVLAFPLHIPYDANIEYDQFLILSNPSASSLANVTLSAPLTSSPDVPVLLSPGDSRVVNVEVDMMVTSDDVEDKGMHVSSDVSYQL